MKKINSNTNNFNSIELREQDEKRYDGELYQSLVVKPEGWTEEKGLVTSGRNPAYPKRLGQLHAIEAFALGKYYIDEFFHLYTDTSEVMLTKTIGVVSSRHPVIVEAQAKGMREINLVVPQYGLMRVGMPWIHTEKGVQHIVISSWLALSQDGEGKGDLFNTDLKGIPYCKFLHNPLEELGKGNGMSVMITFDRLFDGTISTKVYDEAIRIHDIITSKDFNPKAILEQKKVEFVAFKEVSHVKSLGKTQEEEAQKKGIETTDIGVLAVIDGVEMDCLKIPAGGYVLATAQGKKFGAEYRVASNGDRRGLSNRVDPTTKKVYLVRVR